MRADLLFILHLKIQAAWERDCTWLPYINNNKKQTCHSQGKTLRDTQTHMPAQLMTCSDCLAHRTVCRLYGQLLITKPLDSFRLYLVLSPSWLWVSSGLQESLFPYLGCYSSHPWRDKSHCRFSVFITHQTACCVWELWLLCWWLWDEDQGLAVVKFRFEKASWFFFSQSPSQGQGGQYRAMKCLWNSLAGTVICFCTTLVLEFD